MAAPDDVLVRAVKLSRVPSMRVTDVCERLGLSRADWKRARALTVRLDDVDLVLMALFEGPGTVGQIVEFVDWVDHVRWPEDEMTARLERLAERGLVGNEGDRWVLRGQWP